MTDKIESVTAEPSAPQIKALINGPREGVQYPLKVQYCGECSLPIEYCEFYPNFEKCKQWLERNLPELFNQLKTGDGVDDSATSGETSEAGGEKKKRQTRGGKALVKTKNKTNVDRYIKLARCNRGKKKYVTLVVGLSTYDIDLKEATKFFSSKFACGSSVTGHDEIVIQGDVKDDLFDLICEKWPDVDEDTIDDLGDIKK